jgi:hypothetical protein
VITLLEILAEVHRFLTIFGDLNGLAIEHQDTSIFEVACGFEAPFGSAVDVREHDSVVESDVLRGSFAAKLSVVDLVKTVNSALAVSLVLGFLAIDRVLESVEFRIDAASFPVHTLEVHRGLGKWESLDGLSVRPILLL